VGTLAVVIYGYFYTVKPAFQNQLLQEQSAKLQLDNERATADLRKTQARQLAATEELESTSQELSKVKLALTGEIKTERQLSTSLSAAVRSELTAKTEAQKNTGELTLNRAALRRSQERLLITNMVVLTLAGNSDDEASTTRGYLISYSKFFQNDLDGDFITNEAKDWPNPYQHLKRALEQARPRKQDDESMVPLDLVNEYEDRLDSMKGTFLCDPVDFVAMKKAFLGDIAAFEPAVEKELQAEIERMKRNEKNPFVYFRVDHAWAESFRSAKRIEKTAQIASDYRGKLVALRRACWEKEAALNLALLTNGKQISRRQTIPP
jgi:hypothetical protein